MRRQPYSCFLIVSLTAFPAQFASGQDALPPVRQLLSETLALCNADRESHKAALNDLAAAQCYLRDFEAARKTLPPYEPLNFFQMAAHHKCASIEVELTGSTANIPPALWNDEFGFLHGDAALALVSRGDFEKALHHIDAIPKSIHSAWNIVGVKLVEKLKEAQQTDHCRKVLLAWASCYDNTDSIFDYVLDRHHFLRLVAWLVEFHERPKAVTLCERWHSLLKADTDIDDSGRYIGLGWADYALAAKALGDKPAAAFALQQAREWLEKAFEAKFDPKERESYYGFAKSYAAIAARQAVVLGDEQAQPAYIIAYDLARQSVNPQYGEYTYERIVSEQLTAGDEKGIAQTLRSMLASRYIARAWAAICEHHLEHSQPESARAAARQAGQWLDQDGFEPFMAHDMAKVAATAALAGEKELAQKLFRRALALSEMNEDPKLDHPWIARMQIHAGLLSEAYDTIRSIPELNDRLTPQAELCLALAKAEP
jgi:hypothetical protein